MKPTNVILRQNVPNLGEAGDLVTVKPGFARNYLLPRGLAFEATAGNIRRLEDEKQRAEERSKRDYLEARRQAAALEAVSLTFNARAGEESKLFGSITTSDIVDAVRAQTGIQLDRRKLHLDEPIKSTGTFIVPAKLHAEVEFPVTVEVSAS